MLREQHEDAKARQGCSEARLLQVYQVSVATCASYLCCIMLAAKLLHSMVEVVQ